ncbi:uncharacterized protein B0I36DRAFT_356641 [Microdochium trichocladiopsis]|uniref:Uncharacterized protein n=1 Tax=Microdochium trichocladiopsis TaxID=1682393 RepID=A0A9P8XSL3_9PEZI|nr:uncharacterized protein B0I36DRAFT_356641 [Microdochium trichocladiopsis]KAH7009401.1 hypothetical protein B0I36DRAFT_356641 [Microdochium trichocladiopsis]
MIVRHAHFDSPVSNACRPEQVAGRKGVRGVASVALTTPSCFVGCPQLMLGCGNTGPMEKRDRLPAFRAPMSQSINAPMQPSTLVTKKSGLDHATVKCGTLWPLRATLPLFESNPHLSAVHSTAMWLTIQYFQANPMLGCGAQHPSIHGGVATEQGKMDWDTASA